MLKNKVALTEELDGKLVTQRAETASLQAEARDSAAAAAAARQAMEAMEARMAAARDELREVRGGED